MSLGEEDSPHGPVVLDSHLARGGPGPQTASPPQAPALQSQELTTQFIPCCFILPLIFFYLLSSCLTDTYTLFFSMILFNQYLHTIRNRNVTTCTVATQSHTQKYDQGGDLQRSSWKQKEGLSSEICFRDSLCRWNIMH